MSPLYTVHWDRRERRAIVYVRRLISSHVMQLKRAKKKKWKDGRKVDFLMQSRSRETPAGILQLPAEDCSVGKGTTTSLRTLGHLRSEAVGKKTSREVAGALSLKFVPGAGNARVRPEVEFTWCTRGLQNGGSPLRAAEAAE